MNRRELIKSAMALSASSIAMPLFATAKDLPCSDALRENKAAFDLAMKQRPELIGFQGINRSLPRKEMSIEGSIPSDLQGAFFRNGPALHERNDLRYNHLFEGDGMIQGFYFDEGKLYHQGKFVKTNKYIKEQQADRFLYSGPDSKLKNSLPTTSPDSVNAANTNVIPVDGKLWALWEAGSPIEIDAKSLETNKSVSLGHNSNYGDKLKGMAFSAHPKISTNGDIWNIGYSHSGHVILYHLNTKGIAKNVNIIKTDYRAGMLHDFLITEKSILLILPSLTKNPTQHDLFSTMGYNKEQPMQILVICKQSLKMLKRFEVDAGFAFHYGNAWEEPNGTIHFDACLYKSSQVLHSMHDIMQGKIPNNPQSSQTVLFTLNSNGNYKSTILAGVSEFPRIHDGFCGKRNQWLYSTSSVKTDLWSDTVAATNISTGHKQQYVYGEDFLVEEHIVVSNSDKEQQGYLIGTALHVPSQQTCLNIFQLSNIANGPICRAWLPYHLPLGFHGNFMYG